VNPDGVLDVIATLRSELDADMADGSVLPLALSTPVYVTGDCLDLVEQARHGMDGEPVHLEDWVSPVQLTASIPVAGMHGALGDWVGITGGDILPGTELPFLGGLFVLERPLSLAHTLYPETEVLIDVLGWRAMRVINFPLYGHDGPTNVEFAVIDCYGTFRRDGASTRRHVATVSIPVGIPLHAVDHPEWWQTTADSPITSKGRYVDDEAQNMMRWLTEHPDLPMFRQDMTLASTIATLYAFAQAEVLETRERQFDRAQRRRAERAGTVARSFTFDLPHRVYTGGADGEPVEQVDWSHRWWVRPHNRVLHRGTPMERTVRVRGYVKGPDGKPFVAKTPVAVLR